MLPRDVIAGRYRILRRLGQGGFSEVFEAEDEFLRRRVSIKAPLGGADVPESIRREARFSVGLRHPNLLELYDLQVMDDGRPCVIREYVDGQPLSVLISGSRLAIPDALNA